MSSSKLKAIELLEKDCTFFAEMSLKFEEGSKDHKLYWSEFIKYSEAIDELQEYIRNTEISHRMYDYALRGDEVLVPKEEAIKALKDSLIDRNCSNCKFLNRTMILLSNPPRYQCDKIGNESRVICNISAFRCESWELENVKI